MPERILGSSTPFSGHVIRVRVDEIERTDGRRTTRDVVEHPGAVAIVAWDGARLAMVRQWRHATGQSLLELPAGTLEPDEPFTGLTGNLHVEAAGMIVFRDTVRLDDAT
jgi:ADP-ribose pyrophosphatase